MDALVGLGLVVFHFPKPKLVPALLGVLETQQVEQVLVVGPVRPFNEAVVPRRALLYQRMGAAAELPPFW